MSGMKRLKVKLGVLGGPLKDKHVKIRHRIHYFVDTYITI